MIMRLAAVGGLAVALVVALGVVAPSIVPGVVPAVVPLYAEIIEQVLVKVNGDVLTKSEFEKRQVTALRNRPEFANAAPSDPELRKAIAELTPDLILEAVDELLLVQRGKELNYNLGDEQFNGIVAGIKKQNNITDEAMFQTALKNEGMTMADLRRSLERTMLLQQVQRVDIMDKLAVSDEESRAYYELHKQDFTTPSEITLREILIEVPANDRGVNVAQDDEAKATAEATRKRLLAGEPFPRLAADLSAAPSKANGGLIGPIKSDELNPQLQQQLAAMKVGDLTPVQRNARGYQILKLESRTETKIKSFEDARGQIADKVVEQKFEAARGEYLDRLRTQAAITWRNEELRKAYDQALAKRGAAYKAAQAPAAGAR
jgi:peptidyl-prolyl cis-trans isomerase SurA